jgi:hypothetical protein
MQRLLADLIEHYQIHADVTESFTHLQIPATYQEITHCLLTVALL